MPTVAQLKRLAEGKGLLEARQEYSAEELCGLLKADATRIYMATALAVKAIGEQQGWTEYPSGIYVLV